MTPDAGKLLSHRLRGFADTENSHEALIDACRSNVPYLEIDTRVDRDGEIYLGHSPWIGKRFSQREKFSKIESTGVKEKHDRTTTPYCTLQNCLRLFKDRTMPNQKLCIDIKDFGFEAEHLERVKQLNLENDVCWVSWIPQSLVKLSELGAQSPLILSHVNLARFGIFGRLATAALTQSLFPMFSVAVIGQQRAFTPLGHLSHGFQHGYVCWDLPERLTKILSDSRGGVCIHKRLISNRLMRQCVEQGLRLWVFSVSNLAGFERYAQMPEVDVVFCDDAPEVLKAISG